MRRLILSLFLLFPFLLSAQSVPNYVSTNGLVAYYPFNGNADDESGNGNNGTVYTNYKVTILNKNES